MIFLDIVIPTMIPLKKKKAHDDQFSTAVTSYTFILKDNLNYCKSRISRVCSNILVLLFVLSKGIHYKLITYNFIL